MPTSCPCPRFPNLHGAVPNLAFKLNASPGAPLESAKRGQSAQVGAWPRWPVAPAASRSSYARWPGIVRFISRRRQSKPRAPPCLRRAGLCLARVSGDRLARRTGGYCIAEWRHIAQSFHGWWFVEVSRATVPTSESESWLGGCHVQPHLPQDVSLYFTWEMILRCRCKRSIRFVQERRDSEKTRGGADLDSALWLLPIETRAIAKQGSWNFATVFTAKVVAACTCGRSAAEICRTFR